eukprot:2092601-Amphidinium_carterae.1
MQAATEQELLVMKTSGKEEEEEEKEEVTFIDMKTKLLSHSFLAHWAVSVPDLPSEWQDGTC